MTRRARFVSLLAAAASLGTGAATPARATGVAGDRLFPSTMTVEDTQNDDEISLPTVSYLRRGTNGDTEGGRDLGFTSEFARLLTPDLSVLVGGSWRRRYRDASRNSGWDNFDVGVKYRTVVLEQPEFLMSTALVYEFGGTGARGVGAERTDTIQPIVSFGKGFGDLPKEAEWLRPLAVTGAAGIAVSTGSGPTLARYGATLQYSLIYRDQHTSLPTPEWMRLLIPLVEFAVETPVGASYGNRTLITAAPGITWIGETMQVTGELLVPLNSHTGRGVGFIVETHFFLDELMPAVFGKPLFAGGD